MFPCFVGFFAHSQIIHVQQQHFLPGREAKFFGIGLLFRFPNIFHRHRLEFFRIDHHMFDQFTVPGVGDVQQSVFGLNNGRIRKFSSFIRFIFKENRGIPINSDFMMVSFPIWFCCANKLKVIPIIKNTINFFMLSGLFFHKNIIHNPFDFPFFHFPGIYQQRIFQNQRFGG